MPDARIIPLRRAHPVGPEGHPSMRRRLPDPWPDAACTVDAPLAGSPGVYVCTRPVPCPNGRPRPHRRHWWIGQKADGTKVAIHWEDPP
jgi:hypothetical protein